MPVKEEIEKAFIAKMQGSREHRKAEIIEKEGKTERKFYSK